MYEPKTSLEMEQKALKLLDTLKTRCFSDKENIKYLSSVLLEYYNDGFDEAILVIGGLKAH
jgi:hypothetical protein